MKFSFKRLLKQNYINLEKRFDATKLAQNIEQVKKISFQCIENDLESIFRCVNELPDINKKRNRMTTEVIETTLRYRVRQQIEKLSTYPPVIIDGKKGYFVEVGE